MARSLKLLLLSINKWDLWEYVADRIYQLVSSSIFSIIYL